MAMVTVGIKLPKTFLLFKEYCKIFKKYMFKRPGLQTRLNWSKPFVSERLGPKSQSALTFIDKD